MSGGGLASDASGVALLHHRRRRVHREHGRVVVGRRLPEDEPGRHDHSTTSRRSTRQQLNAANHDLGSGGLLLLPDQPGAHPHEMVSAGKDGAIYLVDRDNMGHYNGVVEHEHPDAAEHLPERQPGARQLQRARLLQRLRLLRPAGDSVQAFKLTNGLLPTSPTLRSTAVVPGPRHAADDLGERHAQRDPLGRPAERHDRAGDPPRLRPDGLDERCAEGALQQRPGRFARHARPGREVQRPGRRERQGLRRRRRPAHGVRAAPVDHLRGLRYKESR